MPAKSEPRDVAVDTYSFRRALSTRELLSAVGVGVAAGAMAFYVTRILLERTPVTVEGLALSGRGRKLGRVVPGPRAG